MIKYLNYKYFSVKTAMCLNAKKALRACASNKIPNFPARKFLRLANINGAQKKETAMYKMMSKTALARLLNQFSAPMFAIERASSDAPFYFVGLNQAMELSGNCKASDLVGTPLKDVIPPAELSTTLEHYEQCIASKSLVRFHETFTAQNRRSTWDTTLQFVEMPDGIERIVGTTVPKPIANPAPHEIITFDDIHYFSSMADFQLQNLISMFETYQGEDLFKSEAEVRLAKLSGMCRTVQRAVADIKKVVSSAQERHQPTGSTGASHAASTARARNMRSGMLNALITSASDWDQPSNKLEN